MSTYQLHRNGDYFQVAWNDSRGNRIRKSLGKVSRKEAEVLMQELIADHGARPAAKETNSRIRLHDWLDRYLRVMDGALAKSTLDSHRKTCDYLKDFFANTLQIDQISKSDMTDWRCWIKDEHELAESTACKRSREAKRIIDCAIEEDLCVSNPAKKLKTTPPRTSEFQRRFVYPHEYEAVVDHPDNSEIRGMIMLCYWAGLRYGEALRLRRADVLEDRIAIRSARGIDTTKQRDRYTLLEPELQSWIKSNIRGDTVAGIMDGKDRRNVSHRLLREACDRAGVDRFTFTDLRRTRDTIWRELHAATYVCAWLGHTDETAIRHYVSVPDTAYRPSLKLVS